MQIPEYIDRCLEDKGTEPGFFGSLLDRLRQKQDSKGQFSWEYTLEKYRDKLYVHDAQWYWMKHLGEGWFGMNRRENIQILCKDSQLIEGMLEEYRREENKKQKLYLPVSVLLGIVMIIVML